MHVLWGETRMLNTNVYQYIWSDKVTINNNNNIWPIIKRFFFRKKIENENERNGQLKIYHQQIFKKKLIRATGLVSVVDLYRWIYFFFSLSFSITFIFTRIKMKQKRLLLLMLLFIWWWWDLCIALWCRTILHWCSRSVVFFGK